MRFWVSAVVLLGAGAASASPRESGEALVRACAIYDEKAMGEACRGLVESGAAALPTVGELIAHDDANVRWQSVDLLAEIGGAPVEFQGKLIAACCDPDADVRAAAIKTLATLFPMSGRALPLAVKLSGDPQASVRANAWMARWRLAGDLNAPSQLASVLSGRDWMASAAAATHLTEIGEPAVAALLSVGGNASAVEVLGAMDELGEHRAEVIEVLHRSALGEDRTLAAAAILALAHHEPSVVVALCENPDPSVRIQALNALDGERLLLPVFEKAIGDRLVSVRIAGIRGVGRVGECGENLGRKVVVSLEAEDPDLRGAAMEAISALGERYVRLAEDRLRIIADADPKEYLRASARKILGGARP